jgi:hypothetical protein
MPGCNLFHVPSSKRHRIISVAVLALPAAGLESCHLLTRRRRVNCHRAIHWRPHVGLCRRFLHVYTGIRYCTLGCWDSIFGYPRKGHGREDLYVAICIWMFSASWSYDLYLILRDGAYPDTWFPNIFASSVLYVSAGLLWNLEWKEGRGVIFGFMEPSWPEVTDNRVFRKIVWFALPFMVLAAAMIIAFLI